MPSSGARCARFPREQDKVCYYIDLKDLRDRLEGIAPNTEVQERRLKICLSKKKNTIWVTKQRAEELTVTVRWVKANGAVSLSTELLKFSARGVWPVNHYFWLEKRRKAIDPQDGEGLSFSGVPNGHWMSRSVICRADSRHPCQFDTGRREKRRLRAVSSRPSIHTAVLMQRSRLVPRLSN